MPKIGAPRGPGVPPELTTQEADAAKPVTGVARAQAGAPAASTPEAPVPASGVATAPAIAPSEDSVSLSEIGELRADPLFGTGARCTPYRPGEQGLDYPDGAPNAELLALDLHALLSEETDPAKAAAAQALFAAYPGGVEALHGVEVDEKVKS